MAEAGGMFIIHQGDAIEKLRELPEASAHCCITSPPYSDANVVQGFGCDVSHLHLISYGLRSGSSADVPPSLCDLSAFARCLECTEMECVFRLRSLDSQKGKQRFQAFRCAHVGALPVMQVASFFGGWSRYSKSSAKQRVQQGNGVRLNLLDADPFGVHGRGGILPNPHSVSAALDADVSIRVDNSSKISTFREGWHTSHYTPKGGL